MRLNHNMDIINGGHILYSYEQQDHYKDNLLTFIIDGIMHNQTTIVIENQDTITHIREKLASRLSPEEILHVHFINNFTYYQLYGEFCCESSLKFFSEFLEPIKEYNRKIRTWAHVEWKDQENIVEKLIHHEHASDKLLEGTGLICVCAYDGNHLPASLLTSLLTHHEFLMTDQKLVRSTLYKNDEKSTIFPSISAQSNLHSEMDLYKRKLDFIHVVSHEVRNPLTVIKAYASLVLAREEGLSQDSLKKIESINDYTDIIDFEISQIIYTETLLSNSFTLEEESFNPLTVINEVLKIMEVKAESQHITLIPSINNLPRNVRIKNSKVGLRLIISNLINNAIKYSEEQSKIYLDVQILDHQLCIQIKDQGLGMTENQLSNIIENNPSFINSKKGSGVYIVKRLIEMSNGEISYSSEYGKGTEVTIKLPLNSPVNQVAVEN